MTTYIQGPTKGKADMLVQAGAVRLAGPPSPDDLSTGSYVCVVDNGAFEAAAVVDSLRDLRDFGSPSDTRPKQWLCLSPELLAQVT